MNEVSCRFFDVLIADLTARGVPTTRLVQGTAVPPAQLSDKDERIDWDTFLAIMANGATLWSPTEFERLGRRSVEGSRVRFIGVVARMDAAGVRRTPSARSQQRRSCSSR